MCLAMPQHTSLGKVELLIAKNNGCSTLQCMDNFSSLTISPLWLIYKGQGL